MRSVNLKRQIQRTAVAAACQQGPLWPLRRPACAAACACAVEPPCRGHFFSGFFSALFPLLVFMIADPEPGYDCFCSLLKPRSFLRLLLNMGLGMAVGRGYQTISGPIPATVGLTSVYEGRRGGQILILPIPLKLSPASSVYTKR